MREFNPEAEKYMSTHHERDVETGLDYRGARYYDSDIARFLSLDPLAADYVSWSPYNYVLSNPLKYIDPTGMGAEGIEDDGDNIEVDNNFANTEGMFTANSVNRDNLPSSQFGAFTERQTSTSYSNFTKFVTETVRVTAFKYNEDRTELVVKTEVIKTTFAFKESGVGKMDPKGFNTTQETTTTTATFNVNDAVQLKLFGNDEAINSLSINRKTIENSSVTDVSQVKFSSFHRRRIVNEVDHFLATPARIQEAQLRLESVQDNITNMEIDANMQQRANSGHP